VAAGKAQNAFGATRPSGAGAAAGSAGGFSIFNNLAICARHLVQRHGSDRVLVIEAGGSGPSATPSLLAGDRCIRVLSLREAGPDDAGPVHSPLPVQLPTGMAGAAFLDILDSALAGATAGFDPEYVVAGIGFDALATDPVGSLALEPVDFYALGQRLMETGGATAGRIVALLEGGYHAPSTGEATVQLMRALCGLKAA
jgi:acetoin utilization deacetylase AcuC-like enzyme